MEKEHKITQEYLRKIRNFWGLSMSNMSWILGFSEGLWGDYEVTGKKPIRSNETIIRLAENIQVFKYILENCTEETKLKLGKKYINALKIANSTISSIDIMIEKKRNEYYKDWINVLTDVEIDDSDDETKNEIE